MRSLLVLTVAAVVCSAVLGGCGTAKSVWQGNVVNAAEGHDRLSTWNTLVERAQLKDQLSKDAGPLTVFAPVDDAFNALPAGTVEDLQKPQNRTQLVALINNHVVRGSYTTTDLKNVNQLTTLTGNSVPVRYNVGSWWYGDARIINPDWKNTTNGRIHMINKVIMPGRVATVNP